MTARKRMRMFANPHKSPGASRVKELFKSKLSIFYFFLASCLFITMITLPNYAFKQIQRNENIRSLAYKEKHMISSDNTGSHQYLKDQNTTEEIISETNFENKQGQEATRSEDNLAVTQSSTEDESQNQSLIGDKDSDTVYLPRPGDNSEIMGEPEKKTESEDAENNFSQAVEKIVQTDNALSDNVKITESDQNISPETEGVEPNSTNDSAHYNGDKELEATSKDDYESSTESSEEKISKYLNFTDRTALNFMHFHKTGGVSFKTALFTFFQKKIKKTGELVKVRDACYKREIQASEGAPGFVNWRCDWNPIRELPEEERLKYDVIFGHQYRENGAEDLLKGRDLRTFAIMRHPFDRKVSFFFHFFVRERGRDESNVEFEEVRDFLLYNKITDKSADLGQEVGPNYMAGRLLSDGKFGYVGDSYHKYYDVAPAEKFEVSNRALEIIRKYVFVGLQSESVASMCMLRKTIENFNIAHGISKDGTEQVATTARTLNTGSYSLNAKKIWNQFSMEDKILFDRNERVDLTIYAEGEKLFKQQARLFGCSDSIQQESLRK